MCNAMLSLAILTVVPNLASGQQSPAPLLASAVIEGAVINSQNGRIVPRATVVLRDARKPSDARSTRADGTGHFIFKDLDPGAYRLSADRQGYFNDTRRGGLPLTVEVSAGEQRKHLLLRRMPTAGVTGQIIDRKAETLRQLQVRPLA